MFSTIAGTTEYRTFPDYTLNPVDTELAVPVRQRYMFHVWDPLQDVFFFVRSYPKGAQIPKTEVVGFWYVLVLIVEVSGKCMYDYWVLER